MKQTHLLAPVTAIAAAAVILLAVSLGTKGMAADRAEADRIEIMSYMLPTRPASFEEEPYDGGDESIRRVYRADGGYVIEAEASGYAGPMVLWVGVTDGGEVSGVTVRRHSETPGLGRRVQTMDGYPFLAQFLHTGGEAAVGEDIDGLTGATVTSKAVARAVNSAAAVVTGADTSSGATEWGG